MSFAITPLDIKEMVQKEVELPPQIEKIVGYFSQTHSAYWAVKKWQLLTRKNKQQNPADNILYAEGLLIAENIDFFKFIFNLTLIVKCTLDLQQKYEALAQAYQNFSEAWEGKFTLAPKKSCRTTFPSFFLIVPLVNQKLKVREVECIEKIRKISLCILILCWRIFDTAMTLSDIYLLMNEDRQMRQNASFEFVSKLEDYKKSLVENVEKTYEILQKQQNLLNGIKKNQSHPFLKDIFEKNKDTFQEIGKQAKNALKDLCGIFYRNGCITGLVLPSLQRHRPLFIGEKYPPYAGQKVKKEKMQTSLFFPKFQNSLKEIPQ